MAGQRGFVGRSRDDLYAAAESVSDMLAQLKGMSGGRGNRARGRGGRGRGWWDVEHAHQADWDYPPQQEWTERPRGPEGSWWRGRSRGRPGPDRYARDHYPPDPLGPEMDCSRAPVRGPRGRQQNRGSFRQHQPRIPGGEAGTVQQMVNALAQTPNFSMSLLNLLEQHSLQPSEVRHIVATYGHLFRMSEEEVVRLAPRLKLCAAHSSSSGCRNREACDSLHMCPKYVLGWCSDREGCVLGHRWHTDHNLAILKRLSMEYIKYRVLQDLLRKSHGRGQDGEQHQAGPLNVCNAYNNAGCDQLHCPSLHVCLSFVVGLTKCTQNNCKLNHDLLSPACCHLLKLHQLSVNETQRDVAVELLQANPSLKDRAHPVPSAKPRPSKTAGQGQARKGNKDNDAADLLQQPGNKKNQGHTKKERKISSSETETESESESDDSHGKGKKSHKVKDSHASKAKAEQGAVKKVSKSSSSESDSDDSLKKGKGRDNSHKQLPKQQQKGKSSPGPRAQETPKPTPRNITPRRTLWAHYLHGDVTVPQICYYSVEAMCRDEANGCPKLHAITNFHWQVKEQNGRWINLRSEQVTCIERAFCDPVNNSVDLPRLDPSKLDQSTAGLFLLLGRDVWQADFSTSNITNSTKSKSLQLRRLCTEQVTGQSIKASTYLWYFLDINKKWVKYGNVDTAGKTNLVTTITSTDIENHYLKTPLQPLNFKNAAFHFNLDFVSMKQTNQSTGMSREVRRRPKPHLPKVEDKTKAASDSDLPPHWEAMQPEERSRLVTLVSTSDEYKKVVALLGTSVPTTNVVKVDRIQNPFMWRALQNKIKELTVLYKSQTQVNVRQLFHGTSHSVVASICNENFDWRLHGSAVGQAYGRGTYFGWDGAISYRYCKPDPNGNKFMFVARVAIGSVTNGDPSMARPPINPTTSMPYESTVDNVTNPRMIIKYCTQEYYPEYLLTLK